MKTRKAIALIVLLALLTGLLAACGAAEESPYAGTYDVVELEGFTAEQYEELVGESFQGMFVLELKSGGKGSITVEGDKGSIKCNVDDSGNITISDGSSEISGTVTDDGKLDLSIEGLSVVMQKQ